MDWFLGTLWVRDDPRVTGMPKGRPRSGRLVNDGTDAIRVPGITAEQIGAAAWQTHLPVYKLTPDHAPTPRRPY